MLDKRGIILLKYFNEKCSQSGYKIFSLAEIAQDLPKDIAFDAGAITTYIDELVKRELISVRYQDDKEVCLSATIKGRLLCEANEEEKKTKTKIDRRFFIYSFLGAFLGSVVVFSIILIACYFVGGNVCLLK